MTEYLAENSRLRQLSRRYADNQLAYEDYRTARREILEALEAGQSQSAALPPLEEVTPAAAPVFAADSTGIRLPDDSAVFYKTMPPRATAQAEASAAATPRLPADAALDGFDSNARVLALVLVVALLIALIALVYVFIL
ncbi:MAG: hypothetical protein ACRERR_04565 [Moraxellaceae bacterium]